MTDRAGEAASIRLFKISALTSSMKIGDDVFPILCRLVAQSSLLARRARSGALSHTSICSRVMRSNAARGRTATRSTGLIASNFAAVLDVVKPNSASYLGQLISSEQETATATVRPEPGHNPHQGAGGRSCVSEHRACRIAWEPNVQRPVPMKRIRICLSTTIAYRGQGITITY